MMHRIIVGLAIAAGLIFLAFTFVFFAVKFGWTNTAGVIDLTVLPPKTPARRSGGALIKPIWADSEEWQVLKQAILKDQAVLKKVASATDLSPRLIVAMIVPEQLRLFHDEREIFKQIFSPLKILGNQSQFSWGIAGLKPETVTEIEQRVPAKYAYLLEFKTSNHDQERFARITDEQDHYYSYLYVALYLREVISQWQKAGFDISDRPEILATLFNIGFANSHPNPQPQVGGSEIEISGEKLSFGRLAYEFYYSDELKPEF